jgi:hypothetical protein
MLSGVVLNGIMLNVIWTSVLAPALRNSPAHHFVEEKTFFFNFQKNSATFFCPLTNLAKFYVAVILTMTTISWLVLTFLTSYFAFSFN